ncbi:hypothetical protein PTSG_02065 [Salpingoeca rosetta]|uniref:ABC transmembrane type-1 domain-containing protein n=1 Tax=Salpingoeca rosetta (strain ATCC 50818 / BSB-021) TaxID=946362 RepID=F2TZS5_SALR5|nr:uncharacterized protein PTSG_02065 [Salpingoeca rosetta]EGD79099.1 hypothetical protein PTSG_02065 [Salpingoeca rosetta]|eukprot:XP_004998055.1 hypothetical protein PTSG_02065 [Salpingoeca rosetta]
MAVVQTLLGFARQLVPFARRQPRPLKTVAVCLVCIVVSAGLFLVQPLMVRNALDVMFSEDASYSGLYWQCFLMLLNYVALHGVRQIGLFRQGVLAQQIVEDVRVLAFSEMISQGHVAVERRGVGAAQAMLTSDVTHLYTLIRNHATDMLNGLLFSVGGLLLCVAIQPFLTVFVVLLLAPMAFVMKQFDKIGKTAGKKIQESLSDTMDSVSEALMCTK